MLKTGNKIAFCTPGKDIFVNQRSLLRKGNRYWGLLTKFETRDENSKGDMVAFTDSHVKAVTSAVCLAPYL